jgi:hypothetical protein
MGLTKERRTWLAGLKVGDEVGLARGLERPTSIKRVTALTGKNLRVGGSELNSRDKKFSRASGRYAERGRAGEWRIEPLTQELRDLLELHALRDRLAKLDWRGLPLGLLRRVVELAEAGAAAEQPGEWPELEAGQTVIVAWEDKGEIAGALVRPTRPDPSCSVEVVTLEPGAAGRARGQRAGTRLVAPFVRVPGRLPPGPRGLQPPKGCSPVEPGDPAVADFTKFVYGVRCNGSDGEATLVWVDCGGEFLTQKGVHDVDAQFSRKEVVQHVLDEAARRGWLSTGTTSPRTGLPILASRAKCSEPGCGDFAVARNADLFPKCERHHPALGGGS